MVLDLLANINNADLGSDRDYWLLLSWFGLSAGVLFFEAVNQFRDMAISGAGSGLSSLGNLALDVANEASIWADAEMGSGDSSSIPDPVTEAIKEGLKNFAIPFQGNASAPPQSHE